MALLWILVVRPVGRSDLALQEDQLSGFDGRAVTECPGVIMLLAKRRWHLESTDFWQRHDECKHVGMRKFTDVASGKVVVRKEVGAEEQLDSLPEYVTWNSGIDLVELFHRSIVFFVLNGDGRLRTCVSFEFIGSSHPLWMIQGMFDMTSPFISRAILKIDGNMSWRDGTGRDTRLD